MLTEPASKVSLPLTVVTASCVRVSDRVLPPAVVLKAAVFDSPTVDMHDHSFPPLRCSVIVPLLVAAAVSAEPKSSVNPIEKVLAALPVPTNAADVPA